MQSWITKVHADGIEDGKEYFIAKSIGVPPSEGAMFLSKDIKDRQMWSHKPGIAIRAIGNDKLRKMLTDIPDLFVIPVPADADKRWTRRKRRFSTKRTAP